jgi:DNA primase
MKIDELGLTPDDLRDFLARWDIRGDEYVRRGKVEFDANCPFHNDTGRPNWGINLETGFHRCFSCGAKGDFAQLYAHVEQVGPVEAILFLRGQARTPAALHRRLEGALERLQRPGKNSTPQPPGDLPHVQVYGRLYHPHLEERGISRESAKRWGLRYSKMRNAIVIPAHDENQVLWGYIYRNLDPDARTRYLYSKDFHRTEVLYGFQFWREGLVGYNAKSRRMVVVEGAFDTIWVNQAGLPAVGILGSFPSDHHMALMKEAGQVIVMTDKDKAGLLAAVQIGESLKKKVPVLIARYPKYAGDPSEVRPQHLHKMVERAQPYLLWRRRGRI